MARTVSINSVPRVAGWHPHTGFRPPRLEVRLVLDRATTSGDPLGPVTVGLLTGLGVSFEVARRLGDSLRVALHYVTGHSTAARVVVHLRSADEGLTCAATDYPGPRDGEREPVWMRIHRDHPRPGSGPEGDCEPASERRANPGSLLLYRSLDGHIDIGLHIPWPSAEEHSAPAPRTGGAG